MSCVWRSRRKPHKRRKPRISVRGSRHPFGLTAMGTSQSKAPSDGKASVSLAKLVASAGGCSEPIKLLGTPSLAVDGNTGEILPSSSVGNADALLIPDPEREASHFYTRCNNRRHSRCPDCSSLYQADIWHVIQSGIKDASVPLTFVTLTAPGMGAQHHISGDRCTPKGKCAKCGKVTKCGKIHAENSSLVGAPVCGCFQYEKAATWNMLSSRLWNDFITRYRRAYRKKYKDKAKPVPFFRVVEHHKRGLAHHHIIFRGLHSKDLIRECIEKSGIDYGGTRYTYGTNCHVERLFKGDVSARKKVTNYFSKYLTKSIVDEIDGKGAHGRHLLRLRGHARDLAMKERPLCETGWLLAHQEEAKLCRCSTCREARRYRRRSLERLGHAGQVCSKSSAHSGEGRWGKTLGECRDARRQHATKHSAQTLVMSWVFAGQGYEDSPEGVKLQRLAALIADAGERPPPGRHSPAIPALPTPLYVLGGTGR